MPFIPAHKATSDRNKQTHRLKPSSNNYDDRAYLQNRLAPAPGKLQWARTNRASAIVSLSLMERGRTNQLQLNLSETEVLTCCSDQRQHQMPTAPTYIDTTYCLKQEGCLNSSNTLHQAVRQSVCHTLVLYQNG